MFWEAGEAFRGWGSSLVWEFRVVSWANDGLDFLSRLLITCLAIA